MGTKSKSSPLSQLYHQEGIRAIIATLRRGFEELHEAKFALLDGSESAVYSSSKVPRISFRNKMKSFSNLEHLQLQTRAELGGDLSRHNQSNDSLHLLSQRSASAKYHSQQPTTKPCWRGGRPRSVSEVEPILLKLERSADQVLNNQQKTVGEIIASRDVLGVFFSVNDVSRRYTDINSDTGGELAEDSENRGLLHGLWDGSMGADIVKRRYRVAASDLGLFINLLLTCLYMANIYVIAPTSGEYATLLGMSKSMSGLIIGLQPIASLLSTLAYSLWTNHNFKAPLVSCVMCSLLGSIVYGMALQCDSSSMIFVGRLLAGLGGSRGISRRYIADHVSLEDRTLASSQFVMANAVGLAAGPT
jgi:hypothetical protein